MKKILSLWCINSTNTQVNQLLQPFISNPEIYGCNKQTVNHSRLPVVLSVHKRTMQNKGIPPIVITSSSRERQGLISLLRVKAKTTQKCRSAKIKRSLVKLNNIQHKCPQQNLSFVERPAQSSRPFETLWFQPVTRELHIIGEWEDHVFNSSVSK